MPKMLSLAFALLLSAAWMQAQTTPQTDAGQAGSATSAQSGAAAGQTSIQGCLQGSNGSFTLTADSGTTYQLQGDNSKLSKHVGHEVEVTGSTSASGGSGSAMSPSSGAAGSTAGSSAGASAGSQTLNVDSVKQVAKTCSNATNK
jgi:hypothetical protein